LNVGSGGGAAAAPTSGGAAAGGDAGAAEEKAEEKEEGKDHPDTEKLVHDSANNFYREGRVRRGYGLRSLRLDSFCVFPVLYFQCMATVFFPTVQIGLSSSFS
jgi:hypothetical protein